ncbi:MAG: DUF1512 domain-containing protein [Candidatus Nanohaloarchaeota archaeon QJJ-9]|nr:DUF1512 domain-containing protein [Candidatus Nanohaloarchaeota archaeon QJJ-9]
MVFGLFGGEANITQMLLSLLMLMAFFIFFPRLMAFQMIYKIRKSLKVIQKNALEAEEMFLSSIAEKPNEDLKEDLEPMKNMVISPPSNLDPSGMFEKLENVLDSSQDKVERYVESLNPEMDEEKKADMKMAFQGVYGANQIYVMIRHFKKLIEDTNNYQIGQMIQMMLPLYKELSESQKKATEAFVNNVPIGDSVGPLIAAKLTENEPEEKAENIMVSEEDLDGEKYVVVQSKGPGSRLGKYGDALEEIVEDNDVEKILTLDAGMRYEGEETGTIVEGSGVMMGGPGVEKGKIEEVAVENDLPLEGYIVKQSGPQASKPMHKKIWNAHENVIRKVRDDIRNSEGKLLIIGVGNTCGIANTREDVEGVENKLNPYWLKQEEETTSYYGLMRAFPVGGSQERNRSENSFQLFQSIVR